MPAGPQSGRMQGRGLWAGLAGALALALLLALAHLHSPAVRDTLGEKELIGPLYFPGHTQGPDLSARAAVLMDARTGVVLYGKNELQRRAPASTTKILTAILALERGRLDEVVTVHRGATRVGGSQIWLEPGEKLTLLELLKGMMLPSGNDAATAIAYHIGGSVEGFARLMNLRARQLGAFHSHFVNPSGLPDPNHYTTAYDLAMIARWGLELPEFRQIVRLRSDQIPWGAHEWRRSLFNTNRLLWGFAGADGVKTGTTSDAGPCLVASATREGWQLLSVVLGSSNRWDDSARLLEYGFSHFRPHQVVAKGQKVGEAEVYASRRELTLLAAQTLVLPLRVEDISRLQWVVELLQSPLIPPVQAGQGVGWLKALLDGQLLGQVPVMAGQSVHKRGRSVIMDGGN